jgi:hypothetical protein
LKQGSGAGTAGLAARVRAPDPDTPQLRPTSITPASTLKGKVGALIDITIATYDIRHLTTRIAPSTLDNLICVPAYLNKLGQSTG